MLYIISFLKFIASVWFDAATTKDYTLALSRERVELLVEGYRMTNCLAINQSVD